VDETAALDFELRDPAAVRGTVRDQGDKPVVGAEIVASRWRGGQRWAQSGDERRRPVRAGGHTAR